MRVAQLQVALPGMVVVVQTQRGVDRPGLPARGSVTRQARLATHDALVGDHQQALAETQTLVQVNAQGGQHVLTCMQLILQRQAPNVFQILDQRVLVRRLGCH